MSSSLAFYYRICTGKTEISIEGKMSRENRRRAFQQALYKSGNNYGI